DNCINLPHRHCIFFFSSRRRHTRSKRDWSSDVCSSDLTQERKSIDTERSVNDLKMTEFMADKVDQTFDAIVSSVTSFGMFIQLRSEERRVGKSVDIGGRRIIKKKNCNEKTYKCV